MVMAAGRFLGQTHKMLVARCLDLHVRAHFILNHGREWPSILALRPYSFFQHVFPPPDHGGACV